MTRKTRWLIPALLLCAAAALPAQTADKFVVDLNKEGNGAVIVQFKDQSFAGAVTIPAVIEGFPVTELGEYSFKECALSAVVIPDSVSVINLGAFYNCAKLSAVTLPKNLRTIGLGAFALCTSLKSIEIPAGVTSIGKGAFFKSGLTAITIPPGVTTIRDNTFAQCPRLTEVTIPAGVERIEAQAFQNCPELVTVRMPARNITYTETDKYCYAFYQCPKLSLSSMAAIQKTGYPTEHKYAW